MSNAVIIFKKEIISSCVLTCNLDQLIYIFAPFLNYYLLKGFLFSASQSQLPATGASLPRYQLSEGTRRFDAWVRFRTKRDWKFFLFSKVIRSWFDSYQKTVSPSRRNDFERSIAMWLRDHCSLRVLRSSMSAWIFFF